LWSYNTRALGIRVAPRGSGAGSMVNHALFGATANPLEHRLLFERFLSERRTSLPDIDLDVESERRLEVYDAIIKRFGKERTAAPACPKPTGRATPCGTPALPLRIPPQVVGEIAKSFPHIRARDIRVPWPNCRSYANWPLMKRSSGLCRSSPKAWTRCRGATPCTRAE
jgi:error-prone DNA polymerase